MSNDIGSFTNNPEVVSAAQLRPNNNGLGNVLVDESVLNLPNRGAAIRPPNSGLNNILANSNQPVGSGQVQANDRDPNENLEGGSFLTKNHPRLARDPTWYPGRGRDKFHKALKSIGNVVGQVGQVVADNPELLAV